MYETPDDPYCYKGTSVLKNRLGLRNPDELLAFEAFITAQRADEPLPLGNLDVRHYRAVHRHLFQDVYRWAGRFRTVRLAKEESQFCYPENIDREMRRLFGWLADENFLRDLEPAAFAEKTAHFLAELNAIHPFREGNGRTQHVLLAMLAYRAGHPLDLSGLDPQGMLAAMIASFRGNEAPLAGLIAAMMRSSGQSG